MATTETPWVGFSNDKVVVQSGQISSTIKDSASSAAVDATPGGAEFDGTNMVMSAWGDDKLMVLSGKVTQTLKTSQDVSAFSDQPADASSNADLSATPWSGETSGADKLFLQSGQFESTLKTSLTTGSGPYGISWDGTNTPWTETTATKLFLTSGQFTSTLKTSLDLTTVSNTGVEGGISWDGVNTPYCGYSGDRLIIFSGQFESTIKSSLTVTGDDPFGISTDDYQARLGITDPNVTQHSFRVFKKDLDD